MKKGLNIYNLGSGKGVSVMELVTTFERVNCLKVNYKIVERRPGDLAEYYADPSKALKELEWKTRDTISMVAVGLLMVVVIVMRYTLTLV